MNQNLWKISTAIVGGLFLMSLVFLVLFGLKISSNNKDKLAELNKALATQDKTLKKAFQDDKEQTTTRYISSELFGSFEFSYPKVWSTSVHEADGKTEELTFLADPNLIVLKDGQNLQTALHVVVYKESYATELKNIEGKAKYSSKTKLTETDVTVSGVAGKRFTGTTDDSSGKNVQFILLPLRDKSIYFGSDDFDNFKTQYNKALDSLKVNK